jgi:esterase/lipase
MKTLAEDAQNIINYAKSLPWVDKGKIFALGHSLGTTACLLFSHEFSGLILLSAPTRLWNKLNFIEKALYPVLYYLVALPINFIFNFSKIPLEFKVPYKFKKRHIFKSKKCARAADIDLQKFSPGSNFELVCEHDNLVLAIKNNKPTLVIVGKYDRATGVNDSKKISDLIPAKDKELKIFENSGHSILLDQEGIEVADYIVEWVKKFIGGVS